jgi:hypothetical protein
MQPGAQAGANGAAERKPLACIIAGPETQLALHPSMILYAICQHSIFQPTVAAYCDTFLPEGELVHQIPASAAPSRA